MREIIDCSGKEQDDFMNEYTTIIEKREKNNDRIE